MKSVFVSFEDNTIKLSTHEGTSLKGLEGTYNNEEHLIEVFNDLFSQLTKESKSKYGLIVLADPGYTFFRFITVDKSTQNIDDFIVGAVAAKLDGVNIDDLYFGSQKIAPFVYQFVGVKKTYLDGLLEVANSLGISLQGVIPWPLLLPKFMSNNDPSVFALNRGDEHVIALSELNGVYFCESYKEKDSPKDLSKLISDLSVYKRPIPISTIYTINDVGLALEDKFTISPLFGLTEEEPFESGFELHYIAEYVLNLGPRYLETQMNLLSLLPVPVVVEKDRSSLVYAGAALMALLVLGGGFYYYTQNRNSSDSNNLATTQGPDISENVLSEHDPAIQEQTGEDPTTGPLESEEPNETVGLDKKELKIRVENGAGIAGIAADTQSFLENLEYNVVSIGNADVSGRTDTLLSFKPSKIAYKDMLTESMESSYTVVVDEELSEDVADYDVLIIVGSN